MGSHRLSSFVHSMVSSSSTIWFSLNGLLIVYHPPFGSPSMVSSSSKFVCALDGFSSCIQNSVVSGFQLATAAGLICDEPMWGLAFVIEACISPLAEQSESNQQSEQYAIFARQVMTAVKDACRAAILQKKP